MNNRLQNSQNEILCDEKLIKKEQKDLYEQLHSSKNQTNTGEIQG